MRLIDADALFNELEEDKQYVYSEVGNADQAIGLNMAQLAVATAPTIEAVPVVHGRWDEECRCTACGWYGEDKYKRDALGFNYCPNCGARMDGDGDV